MPLQPSVRWGLACGVATEHLAQPAEVACYGCETAGKDLIPTQSLLAAWN